jgi:hypothetical protein
VRISKRFQCASGRSACISKQGGGLFIVSPPPELVFRVRFRTRERRSGGPVGDHDVAVFLPSGVGGRGALPLQAATVSPTAGGFEVSGLPAGVSRWSPVRCGCREARQVGGV